MPLFLDNLIENFYEPVGTDFRRSYARGQIFWTHIGYSREDLQLWRPTGLDPSQTTVNSFRMEPAGKDAFKRAMPLYIPPLETNEELIVAKAKRRPVILLSPVPAHPGIPDLVDFRQYPPTFCLHRISTANCCILSPETPRCLLFRADQSS